IGGRRLAVEGDAIVIAESFDISGWTPGEYTLRVSISAPESEIADSADLPIRIVTPVSQQATLAQSVLPSRYDSLNLEDRINLLKYQLTPNEKMTLERLTNIGQENFIRQFWRDHAVPPQGSARNREELVQWYDHVARAFADNVSHKSGWATDRGRVYLTYGPPSEVEEFPAPITGPPFEVWFYRQLREGKVFVFVDWSGSHDYRMEHSDVLGEKFSQDWDDRIKQGLLERY
ncbi:MAG: GWxTD domain-containing protein, partial [Candidatus Zixiibacteriota bacterium]